MRPAYQVKTCFGPTIQGEGPRQGAPCVFLRLAGCNAWDGRSETRAESACPYCDTDFRGGEPLDAAAILQRLRELCQGRSGLGLVISGGEPLLQVDEELIALLAPHFPWIDIETNGTRPAPPRPPQVQVVCSPKAVPGQPLVVVPDAWKILIPAQEQFLAQALESPAPVWLQPVCPDHGPSGPAYAANLARCLDLAYRHGCRISIQAHKYLGVE
ncbi:MAG: 4Fe-4S cluster-binding domain-containing protein [Planctomycetota bacterium]|nr:MAG: 4Fe-4S cluster-binding domain-containing protein [Planctomycetota bacterium]